MEGPGISIFKDGLSLHINNSAQDKLEELEDKEDENRRRIELGQQLDMVFDNISIDEASSLNCSANFTNNGEATHMNNSILPPPYGESHTCLKNIQHEIDVPKPSEILRSHLNPHMHHLNEPIKYQYSPCGAGDGQNPYYNCELKDYQNGIHSTQEKQELFKHEIQKQEIQNRTSEIEKMKTDIDSLRARLGAVVNENSRQQISLQEAQNLNASSKQRIFELEQEIQYVSNRLTESELEKKQLILESQVSCTNIQDLQLRLQNMKLAHTHDTDALFREHQDKHREEVDRLQNELIKVKNRLEQKDIEIKQLERQCFDKDRDKKDLQENERILNEQKRLMSGEANKMKERVAKLSNERNTAKEQVKELGSKLKVTADELAKCRHELSDIQNEYESWRAELKQIIQENSPDISFMGDILSLRKLSTLKEVLSHYKQKLDKMTIIQEELAKCEKKLEQHKRQESDLHSKLDEKKEMELKLNSKLDLMQKKLDLLGSNSDSDLLESYKMQNDNLKTELDNARAELKNLDLKYTELELEQSKRARVQEANADHLKDLEKYSRQLEDTLNENGKLKHLYLEACSSREAAIRELKSSLSKTQKERDSYKSQEIEYVEKIEKERQQIEKLVSELNSTKAELDSANKRISELQKEFTDKQKEFTEKLNKFLEDEKSALRNDMEPPCSQCIRNIKHIRELDEQLSQCTVKLATQESTEVLFHELKDKAKFFEQYIMERHKKLCEQRSVATNTDETHTNDTNLVRDNVSIEKMVEDYDAEIADKTALMIKEKDIRDQIAEKFTLEMKTIEMDCARKLKTMENDHIASAIKLKELLERKAKEVESLKEFILNERNKIKQILEAKESEISMLIKEHNEMQTECQNANDESLKWRVKAEKYKEKLRGLGSLEDMMKKEREDFKQKTGACAKEWQTLKAKTTDLQGRLRHLEIQYEQLQNEYRHLQEKYKNCKKTVFTYKDYMSKKDTHINNEMSRIQDEYRKIFVRLQSQLDSHTNTRQRLEKNNERSTETRQFQHRDFSDNINRLNEDFARLAKSRFNSEPNLNSH